MLARSLVVFSNICTIKKINTVTMRLNYRGDCVSVIMSDSVHFLCFSKEKLVALENKAAEGLGASFIKVRRLESDRRISKVTSSESEQWRSKNMK